MSTILFIKIIKAFPNSYGPDTCCLILMQRRFNKTFENQLIHSSGFNLVIFNKKLPFNRRSSAIRTFLLNDFFR
jgi:hypothetical protein